MADNALGDAGPAICGATVSMRRRSRPGGSDGPLFLSPGAGVRPSDIVYDRQGSSFALAAAGDFDWSALLDGADLLHVSGVTPALGRDSADAAIAAAAAARARGISVSFDTNYRSQLWGRRKIDPAAILGELVGRADILFGNHRDISLLLGRDFSGDGEKRRREAAEAAFAAFEGLKLIASTARHTVDADTHRIAARIDGRGGAVQTKNWWWPGSSAGSARATLLPPASCTACGPGSISTGSSMPGSRWLASNIRFPATPACSARATSRRSSPASAMSAAESRLRFRIGLDRRSGSDQNSL